MIKDTLSRHKRPALTSDRWHVVHARWSGNVKGEPRFERSITSEHEDRDSATEAARKLQTELGADIARRPASSSDQIFVRRPNFSSLKAAPRWKPRSK